MASDQGTTARERATLRGIVRQQYRVLRGEIDARVAALRVEADARLREKYDGEDTDWKALVADVNAVIARAQIEIDELIQRAPVKPEQSNYTTAGRVRIDYFSKPTNAKRNRLEQEFSRAISAKASEAKRTFDRQEADALRELAVEDIKTPAARAFLDGIPTIQQALPSSDLLAVEARVDG